MARGSEGRFHEEDSVMAHHCLLMWHSKERMVAFSRLLLLHLYVVQDPAHRTALLTFRLDIPSLLETHSDILRHVSPR